LTKVREAAGAPAIGALGLAFIIPGAATIKKSRPTLANTIAMARLMPRAARVAIVDLHSRLKFVVRLTPLVFISASLVLFARPLFLRPHLQSKSKLNGRSGRSVLDERLKIA
jgi:hypothetical protein